MGAKNALLNRGENSVQRADGYSLDPAFQNVKTLAEEFGRRFFLARESSREGRAPSLRDFVGGLRRFTDAFSSFMKANHNHSSCIEWVRRPKMKRMMALVLLAALLLPQTGLAKTRYMTMREVHGSRMNIYEAGGFFSPLYP